MGVRIIKITLNDAYVTRNTWSFSADGAFTEGIHLVSGDVGSGKSTLALMMAGLFPVSAGSIVKDGISSCMLSLQFPELHVTGMTLADECSSWGVPAREILASAGLSGKDEISPFSLSRGELKRLHLGCVLAHDYDLLLLDEPFSSLDCEQKAELCTTLERRSAGITIIFTHEQNILPRVFRIWEIAGGRLMDCGSPPDAFVRWHHLPPAVKKLIALGSVPDNISQKDLREAACRIHEYD
jgi:energy-coupling factor transport system ATP-binding protein